MPVMTNIWIIRDHEFDMFVLNGGKVVYIVEDGEPRFKTHPAVITAGALLPPVESIAAELDHEHGMAEMIYNEYLMTEEVLPYIATIVAAAMQGVPVGIMFGKDEIETGFSTMFINHLYTNYGLVLGVIGNLDPYIEDSYMPKDLAYLYSANVIDYETFMIKHPVNMPIDPLLIPRLAYDVNPVVESKTYECYTQYFEWAKHQIADSYKSGKILVDPMVSV